MDQKSPRGDPKASQGGGKVPPCFRTCFLVAFWSKSNAKISYFRAEMWSKITPDLKKSPTLVLCALSIEFKVFEGLREAKMTQQVLKSAYELIVGFYMDFDTCLGRFWAPKMAPKTLQKPPWRPNGHPRHPNGRPRRFKGHPRRPQENKKVPKGSQMDRK